ncbi:MAG: biotin carboxylase N-terminal domain-containing protein, partial [Staphylococcus epidermidis]|nr:biotin carboxylase N-terminal domain-containing protein [Staphylococcus epidermidis]
CRELNIETVAIYAKGDENSLHVSLADQAICIGEANPLDSYLNIDRIISAAKVTESNVIHPGYGFLSESTNFAKAVEDNHIHFIGPSKTTMEMMGDKITARQTVKQAGVPVIPGSNDAVQSVDEIKLLAKEIGFPVVLKAASGGGGKGIRIVKEASQLDQALKEAKSEGQKYFNDNRVYVEAFIPVAKHVEVQIIGDGKNNYVHLGERDCSVQRKNQKLIEEAPCAALTEERRTRICGDAVKVAQASRYRSAGTIEFLVTEDAHYFIEMNARIQVLPTPGKVNKLHLPQGFNIRVDSLLYTGYQVSPYYDSLVAKVIVKDSNRQTAINKLKVALDEMVIEGFTTTADFLYAVLNYPIYAKGDASKVDIKFLEKHQIIKEVK